MTREEIERESRALGESADCAVRALAAVTGFAYLDVWAYLDSRGRVPCEGTDYWLIRETLRVLECRTVPRPELREKGRTVRTLGRYLANRKGRFLVDTAGHILAIVDGEVMDWTRGRLHRVQDVCEVFPSC